MEEEFEDIKGVIRIRKWKKNRQHNGQKKKDKETNNDLQTIHLKRRSSNHENQRWTHVLRNSSSSWSWFSKFFFLTMDGCLNVIKHHSILQVQEQQKNKKRYKLKIVLYMLREQKLPTLPKHSRFILSVAPVARSFVLYVVFCRSLFVLILFVRPSISGFWLPLWYLEICS